MWSQVKTGFSLAWPLAELWNINCSTGIVPLIPKEGNSQVSWHCSAKDKCLARMQPWAVSSETLTAAGEWERRQQPLRSTPCTAQTHLLLPSGLLHPGTISSGFWLVTFSGLICKRRVSRRNHSFPGCSLSQGYNRVTISFVCPPFRCSSLEACTSADLGIVPRESPLPPPPPPHVHFLSK